MDKQLVLDELKIVLAPYTAEKEALSSVNEHTDLIKDLKINSANIIDIIIDAETRYDIEIDVDSAERMSNVGSCLEVIMEKIAEKE